ncbi:hypothetical protein PLANTIT3_60242 [Plantibacter sp. T3]|nr:hypothetical protein PLANTIT3_60242 [Plantibacter sp. T3]
MGYGELAGRRDGRLLRGLPLQPGLAVRRSPDHLDRRRRHVADLPRPAPAVPPRSVHSELSGGSEARRRPPLGWPDHPFTHGHRENTAWRNAPERRHHGSTPSVSSD